MQAELEATIIGSLLLREDAYFELPPGFTGAVLAHETARTAFRVIERLLGNKRSAVMPLVATEAGFNIEQTSWLKDAVQEHGTTNTVRPYAEKLLDLHRRRETHHALTNAQEALRSEKPVSEIVGSLLSRLFEMDKTDMPETVQLNDAAHATLDELERRSNAVIRTGFSNVDQAVWIHPGNLLILAARPGVGKSTLALNMAENIARTGGRVLFHSLEMDDAELVCRVLSRLSGVMADQFFSGVQIPKNTWDKIIKSLERQDSLKHGLLLNTRHHDVADICRITEKEHRKGQLSLVVVDYIQLVHVDAGKGANEEQRIGTASRMLKLLAQRLHVPVLAVAQLNRETERRGDEKKPSTPRLSDLRGSGRLEQDANTVLFLSELPNTNREYELVVAKQRAGRRGKVALHGDLDHAQFREMAPRAMAQESYDD